MGSTNGKRKKEDEDRCDESPLKKSKCSNPDVGLSKKLQLTYVTFTFESRRKQNEKKKHDQMRGGRLNVSQHIRGCRPVRNGK